MCICGISYFAVYELKAMLEEILLFSAKWLIEQNMFVIVSIVQVKSWTNWNFQCFIIQFSV